MIQRNFFRRCSPALHAARHTRLISPTSAPSSVHPHPFRTYPSHPTLVASRWYSAAPEPTEGESSAAATNGAGSKEAGAAEEPSDPLKKEMEVKDKEIIDLKDRYLRSVADFRNLQDRTKRDVQAARDFAIQRFAKDLIESIDNLDRALETVPAASLNLSAATDSSSSSPSTSAPDSSSPASESSTTSSPSPSTSRSAPNKDLVNLYDGLKMTSTILMQTLGKHGLVRFDPSEKENQRFDPNLHEATFQTPVEGREDGTVFHTQQKGFLLNGRVLRAAKVGVVKNA